MTTVDMETLSSTLKDLLLNELTPLKDSIITLSADVVNYQRKLDDVVKTSEHAEALAQKAFDSTNETRT